MTKAGRKSSPIRSRQRKLAKLDRDRLNLEYLRHCRDEALPLFGIDPMVDGSLSVYNTYLFPVIHQFKEENSGKGIRYSYNEHKMPNWSDITNEMKIGLFMLIFNEEEKRLFTFNPHVHDDLIRELHGKDIVKELAKRMARYLKGLGSAPSHYAFVVEGHGKSGESKRLHIHGLAMVNNKREADAVTEAAAKAAGQIVKGRGRIIKGSRGEFCYYVPGKSWSGYMLKNSDKLVRGSNRRSLVISREETKLIRDFYNLITGQD